MKNTILFIITILLVLIAYFHEEIGKKNTEEKILKKNRIVTFNPEMIDRIELPRTKLVKVNRQWLVEELDYPANTLAVENLLKHLYAIHQIRPIQYKKNNQNEFFVDQNHLITLSSFGKTWKYRLGDISQLTGNFYFSDLSGDSEKLYLARDTTTFQGFYKTELELYLNQYIQLKDFIFGTSQAFLEPKVFYNLDIETDGLESIKINNKWNRWFEVQLNNEKTIPPVQKGLRYRDLKVLTKRLIDSVTHEGIIYKGKHKGKLSEEMSTITFKGFSKKIIAKLYSDLDGKKGFYVAFKGFKQKKNLIYKLKKDAEKIFFINVQSFWNKKVQYPIDIKSQDRFSFSISKNQKKKFLFYVDDLKTFEFKSENKQIKDINVAHMNFLFNLLLGLDRFEQADRVEEIRPSSKNIKFSLYVGLLGVDLRVDFYPSHILIVNHTEKYQLYYDVKFANLEVNSIDDFFALK